MAIIQSLAGVPSPAAFSHFTGAATAAVNATNNIIDGGWGLIGVNEGSTSYLIDEPNGVLQITNDTGDDDNQCLVAGMWQPQHGNMVMEARLKVDNVTDLAIWVGFTETLAIATPVMPAEYATATMTYNGTGGMVGLQFDSDGTTDIWRSAFGDGGAITSGATAGGVSGARAAVANVYDIVTVEIDADGTGRVYLNGVLVESVANAVTVTDNFFAAIMVENRAGSAAVWEIDYALARGGADYED
jgi:hypothetical protein